MMTRQMVLAVCTSLAISVGPCFSASYEENIQAQLTAQGYQNVSISYTWLGRARIVAMIDGQTREIVLDPNTGEILRDLTRIMVAEGPSTGSESDRASGGTATVAATAVTSASNIGGGGQAGGVATAAASTAANGSTVSAAQPGAVSPLANPPSKTGTTSTFQQGFDPNAPLLPYNLWGPNP